MASLIPYFFLLLLLLLLLKLFRYFDRVLLATLRAASTALTEFSDIGFGFGSVAIATVMKKDEDNNKEEEEDRTILGFRILKQELIFQN